jgi:hypothetical protein
MNLARRPGSEPFQLECCLLPSIEGRIVGRRDLEDHMKTLIATLAAVAAVTAVAAPAAAQPYGGYERHENIRMEQRLDQRLERLDRRIDREARQGDLTRREAFRLSARLNEIERLQNQYRRGGYTRWELSDLDRRLDTVEQRIHAQARDDQYARRW